MRSEFEFIQNIKDKYLLNRVGDDCAVLPKDDKTDMVVTSDMLVEDIDFRLKWTTPEFLGHKALAVSLSDIAAMGATPTWALLSIGVPENLWKADFLDRFYEGWHKLAANFAVELVGGDVSRSPDTLTVDSILGGEVARGKAILRSSAKPGDAIFVSGTLGAAAGGLKLLENRMTAMDHDHGSAERLIDHQLRPQPQIELAKLLLRDGTASSAIDISDGFSADLMHLCVQSGVGALIADIPVNEDLRRQFSHEESVEMALHGGEDFELIFTVAPEKISAVETLAASRVGTITSSAGIVELTGVLRTSRLTPKGYRHF